MEPISPVLAGLALEHCEPTPFEKFAQVFVGSVLGQSFKPLGGVKDGGADGFVDNDIREHVSKTTTFFQASKEIDTEGKVRRTMARLAEVGRTPKSLYYATSREVKDIDKLQSDLSEELSANIRIYDRNFISQRVNNNGDVRAAYDQYLKPSIAFLEALVSPSFPSSGPTQNARQLSAFLGQETERRLGRAKALESICDALVLWSLEETDPDKGKFLSEAEIVSKVETAIPSAKQFFRGVVKQRLAHLARKQNGVRLVSYHAKAGGYCLPYESRQILNQHAIEDEALKLGFNTALRHRITATSQRRIGDNLINTAVEAIQRTLERLFETQGFAISRHFLDSETQDDLPSLTISDIAAEELHTRGIYRTKSEHVHSTVKRVLGRLFYESDDVERKYLGRLSRTYMLLFTIKNTPEIIEYFNTMAKNFYLYVGSDLIIRALSEYYLQPADQMTVNSFKILRLAGSKLILTEQMLEEVHSHLNASNQEYINHYLEVDKIVDRDLASQSDRILIRAYYYAKLDESNPKRPTTWSEFLGNFLTVSKLRSAKSADSMRSLKETVCNRFGFAYETRDVLTKLIDNDKIDILVEKLKDMKKREELARNDAELMLSVVSRRKTVEHIGGNPYGFKTWYLTQDIKCKGAYIMCFPNDKDSRYIMTPEFLLNYIAFNPTGDEVRRSLENIFPSVLGVRLGERLPDDILDKVLSQIREAFKVDVARATAIVAEHSDALKSGNIHDFVVKYNVAPKT